MSDFETLKEMFERAPMTGAMGNSRAAVVVEEANDEHDGPQITVENGYMFFVSQFDFDKDGNLVTVSAWE